jgi:hypothetical protein
VHRCTDLSSSFLIALMRSLCLRGCLIGWNAVSFSTRTCHHITSHHVTMVVVMVALPSCGAVRCGAVRCCAELSCAVRSYSASQHTNTLTVSASICFASFSAFLA